MADWLTVTQEAAAEATDPGLERLVFFSDAVVAIAITLLALDLPVPEGDTNKALLHSFAALIPKQYLTFLLSFVVVAAYWRSHHRLFQHVVRMADGLVALNNLYLLTIVLLPFATRVLGEKGTTQFGTILYAISVASVGLSLLLLLLLVVKRGLLRADAPRGIVGQKVRAMLVPLFAFPVSIPISFAGVDYAKYSWLFLSLLAIWAERVYKRLRGVPG
jgi:uncharacterized membrane protein